MKKAIFWAGVIMMLTVGRNFALGQTSVIVNRSFENDGIIDPITKQDSPQRWYDVDLSGGHFGGWVGTDWSTEGSFSLTLYSKSSPTFLEGELGSVSQYVYLEDVEQIKFDIKLEVYPSTAWYSSERSVVLLINGNVAWQSDVFGAGDIRGTYLDQICVINPDFVDPELIDPNVIDPNLTELGLHKLSLGLRSNVNAKPYIIYRVKWDFLSFDTHCYGYGYRPGDLNQDCDVDINDLGLLADEWLGEPSADKYDLYENDSNVVDLSDYSVLADNWRQSSIGYQQDDGFLAMDLNNDGITNHVDLVILALDAGDGLPDYEYLAILADEWLYTSGLYGLE